MNSMYLHLFASAPTGESADLLGMLGIDVKTLIFQIIAFLILVVVLGKWVYPVFVSIIDKREADIAASSKAAEEAKKAADHAEGEVAALLAEAKREAADIVTTAKTEATAMVDAAEKKAKKRSEALVAAARDDIENDMKAARDQLHNEMVDLVTAATEKVVGRAVSAGVDESMIAGSIKEAAN